MYPDEALLLITLIINVIVYTNILIILITIIASQIFDKGMLFHERKKRD